MLQLWRQGRGTPHFISLLIFIFFLLFYGLTSRADVQVSDEAAVLATSIALATRGELAIDELQWLQDAVNIGQKGPDGHLYAKYFPGNAFSAALIYKVGQRQHDDPFIWNFKTFAPSVNGARWALKLNAIFGALAMMGLFLLLARYFSWQTAILTTLLIGVCSDWWYQSRGFLSEVGAGAFTVMALYFATVAKPYLSSSALAISLLFRPLNLVAIPIWLFSIWSGGRKAIWSIFPIVISLSLLAAYNVVRFGSPLDFGYGDERFNSSLFVGLYGILLSPGRSLFLYSPLLLLALPGAVLLYRTEKRLAIVCLTTIVSYLLVVALWHSWDGGWTWGSRLLTPIIPLAGVLMTPLIMRIWTDWRLLVLVALLASLGLGVQIAALAKDPLQVMIENVANGNIDFKETVYTVHNSWLAMQLRSLSGWQPCDIDAFTLRSLLNACS